MVRDTESSRQQSMQNSPGKQRIVMHCRHTCMIGIQPPCVHTEDQLYLKYAEVRVG